MKNLKRRGFTLIEMLIVVVIIGILAAALIPRLGSAKGKANDSSRATALSQIGNALATFVLDYGVPTTGAAGTSSKDAITGVLAQGGLVSVPADPASQNWTSFANVTVTGGYAIYQVKKGSGTGFAIVAKVEAPTSANWIDNGAGWAPWGTNPSGTDMGSFNFCTKVSDGSASTGTLSDCKGAASTWRKIVIY